MSRIARIGLTTLLVTGLLLFWGTTGNAQDPPIPPDTEVVTTASGLKYSVLKKAEGVVDHPKMGERVRAHYTGWLTDGTSFESSRGGEPLECRLDEYLIQGWNEGLQLMSPGDVYKLTIPPELGYGDRGKGSIPPNSTLVFELELLSIAHAPAFVPLDAEKSQTTASGLKYQVLQEGTGRLALLEDLVDMVYAFWQPDGTIIDASALSGGNILGPLNKMRVPFLQEGPLLMKVGSKLLFEVPPALGFANLPGAPVAPDATTIWQLELVRIVDVPRFEMPPEAELTTTASGLKYKMLVEGTGASPKMYEHATCNYAGWLTDGSLFDSSYITGKPFEFMVGRMVQGWNEGVQLMKEGGSAILVVAPGLAWGNQPQQGIPPDSTVVFRIDLIRVGKEEK